MSIESVGAVVIGAGVVGLACARELARRGIDTLIIERHGSIGQETSSRNSEVIHAGFYYPAGSNKARLCVQGRHALYEYCARAGVPHRRCGKLVVADSPSQEAKLQSLHEQGVRNGVTDLRMLTRAEARALEPGLECSAALLSPSTGILDSHALMLSLLADAEGAGAVLALRSEVAGCEIIADASGGTRFLIDVAGDGEKTRLQANFLVNAAGLSAPALARRMAGLDPAHVPQAFLAKGSYFALAGKSPFSRLVYPVPEAGGLGVHFTLDLAGQGRFGPDVEWVDSIDYAVDPLRANDFYARIREYWKTLPDGALTPAYSGIRPKIAGPGVSSADFMIQGPDAHGIAGLVNLFGIESPGLTACLAIAADVARAMRC